MPDSADAYARLGAWAVALASLAASVLPRLHEAAWPACAVLAVLTIDSQVRAWIAAKAKSSKDEASAELDEIKKQLSALSLMVGMRGK